ncbi:E3 ubiquitin-protein ligase At1g63170-like, partial [Phalaenopsis equestris]|uniref:E3 ubiquitin-protein ligase At1g63170-like n=1 Tax=Phalaenopsis equestris TaxID=78828 RepID=UPI0009E46ABA
NPILMEHSVDINGHDYIINITRGDSYATFISDDLTYNGSNELHSEVRASRDVEGSVSRSHSPITASSFRNASLTGRRDSHGRRQRSLLNSGLWISIELIVNVCQILAAIIVISLSQNEHPRVPLFAWVIGYAFGCAATLPHLYWRYSNFNSQGFDQTSSQSQPSSFQNIYSESPSNTVVSLTQNTEGRGTPGTAAFSRLDQYFIGSTSWLNPLVDRFKMALNCFFAIWFVLGNVWIFGGHSSAAGAPNLYRLCIAFLAFSCIGYAMPFILCATICCCFPCIISFLGFRGDLRHTRGATLASIKAFRSYKFISKRNLNQELSQIISKSHDGGILAVGTDKERLISFDDAVCCICLARYVENDDLRELPCQHFFHTMCVDKWLKINALCPLCKHAVGDAAGLPSILGSIFQNSNQMVGDSADAEQNAF